MKRKKNLTNFTIYMEMATRFNLSNENRQRLISILNEPMPNDYDYDAILNKEDRLISLFNIPADKYYSAKYEERKKVEKILLVQCN